MALITCPECKREISSEAEKCPSCGYPIKPPGKTSTGVKWAIGCAIAAGIGFLAIPVVGLLAAIAIPSFVHAREVSQHNACVNNMRQIEVAKDRWAAAHHAKNGEVVDVQAVTSLIASRAPICPAGGTYSYNAVGKEPSCSVHGTLSEAARSQSRTYPSREP